MHLSAPYALRNDTYLIKCLYIVHAQFCMSVYKSIPSLYISISM